MTREEFPGFNDASIIRRVHSEAVVLLGGGRALLLQLAHPAVAAAVAEHSSFRERRVGRLLGTLKPTLAIVFGDGMTARAAASSINDIHARVRSAEYDAQDPDLLFWVLATLIDTALLMQSRFLQPLSFSEEQGYYEDMLRAGALLGVDSRRAPRDICAFRDYMSAMVSTLTVTAQARRLADELFDGPLLLRAGLDVLQRLTAGLLPERVRDGYGFNWDPGSERVLAATAAFSRRTLRHLPPGLRAPPAFLLP